MSVLNKVLIPYFNANDMDDIRNAENRFIMRLLQVTYAIAVIIQIVFLKQFTSADDPQAFIHIAVTASTVIMVTLVLRYHQLNKLQNLSIIALSVANLGVTWIYFYKELGSFFLSEYFFTLIILSFLKSDYLYYLSMKILFIFAFFTDFISQYNLPLNIPYLGTVHYVHLTFLWLAFLAVGLLIIKINELRAQHFINLKNNSINRKLELEQQNQKITKIYQKLERNSRELQVSNAKLKTQEEQLLYTLNHDALTGLPSRYGFIKAIKQLISEQSNMANHYIIVLNVDAFKQFNNTLGQTIGDNILKIIAERVMQCVTKMPHCARLDGDEFAMYVSIPTHEDVDEKVRSIQNRIAAPIDIAQAQIKLTVSVGVANYPQDGQTINSLLRNAGIAMQHKKQSGRNGIKYYREIARGDDFAKRQFISQLLDDIYQHRLDYVYQPILTNDQRQVAICELFPRWQSEEFGQLKPNDFMPTLVASGNMITFGKTFFERVCRNFYRIIDEIGHDTKLNINISSQEISSLEFVNFMMDCIKRYRVEPSKLIIEIEEQTLLTMGSELIQVIKSFRSMGIGISLDKVGSGHFSFDNLMLVPFDYMKINCKQISAGKHGAVKQVLESLIALTRAMNCTVIVSDIETAEQYQIISAMDIDLVQGYYLGSPVYLKNIE